MENITIGRFEQDSEAQGVIRPESNSWQLVIDKDGYPHLYVRAPIEGGISGLVCLDDMLEPNLGGVRGIMNSVFGEPVKPEEEEAAMREYIATREANPIPCPRV